MEFIVIIIIAAVLVGHDTNLFDGIIPEDEEYID